MMITWRPSEVLRVHLIRKSSGSKSPGSKSSGSKSSGSKSSGLQSSGSKSSGLQSSGSKSSGSKSSGLQSSGLQSPGLQNPGLQSPGSKSSQAPPPLVLLLSLFSGSLPVRLRVGAAPGRPQLDGLQTASRESSACVVIRPSGHLEAEGGGVTHPEDKQLKRR